MEQSSSKIRLNREIDITYDAFELVSCGKVMFLIETDYKELKISSVLSNAFGFFQISLGDNKRMKQDLQDWNDDGVRVEERNGLGFGGYSENEQILVVWVLYVLKEECYYQEIKFRVNLK